MHAVVSLLDSRHMEVSTSSGLTWSERLAGLGLFTGLTPVLFMPVVRSPAVAAFQQAVWASAFACASGIVALIFAGAAGQGLKACYEFGTGRPLPTR